MSSYLFKSKRQSTVKSGLCLLVFLIGLSFIFVPNKAWGQAGRTLGEITLTIERLLKEISFLQEQITALESSTPNNLTKIWPTQIERDLMVGDRGPDVRELQLFLKREPLIYPEGIVSGYFGKLTEAALRRYQGSRGLVQTGIAGQKTRDRIVVDSTDVKRNEYGDVLSTPQTFEPVQRLVTPKPAYDLLRLARLVQEQVNRERVNAGLSPLSWNDELAAVALAHSRDQAFDSLPLTDPLAVCQYTLIRHESFKNGYTFSDRANQAGILGIIGGENIVSLNLIKDGLYELKPEETLPICEPPPFYETNQTDRINAFAQWQTALTEARRLSENSRRLDWVHRLWWRETDMAKRAVSGWMNSLSHRRNLLHPDLSEGGVGIAMVNDYLIITHDLIGR